MATPDIQTPIIIEPVSNGFLVSEQGRFGEVSQTQAVFNRVSDMAAWICDRYKEHDGNEADNHAK